MTDDPPDEVRWMVSGWDHQVHAFHTLADVSAEAACRHIAMTIRLTMPTGTERMCPACTLLRKDQLDQIVLPADHGRDR